MASGSFRDAKLERPVSGAELRRLLVASRPNAVIDVVGKLSFDVLVSPHAPVCNDRFHSANAIAIEASSHSANRFSVVSNDSA